MQKDFGLTLGILLGGLAVGGALGAGATLSLRSPNAGGSGPSAPPRWP